MWKSCVELNNRVNSTLLLQESSSSKLNFNQQPTFINQNKIINCNSLQHSISLPDQLNVLNDNKHLLKNIIISNIMLTAAINSQTNSNNISFDSNNNTSNLENNHYHHLELSFNGISNLNARKSLKLNQTDIRVTATSIDNKQNAIDLKSIKSVN